jgi:hypothetical protein
VSGLLPGDLVIHHRYLHWGHGLVVSVGPVLPVSGLQAMVMWPDLRDSPGTGGPEHCPMAELKVVGEDSS